MSFEPELRPLSDAWAPPRSFRPSRKVREFVEESVEIRRYDAAGTLLETRLLRPTAKGWQPEGKPS